MAGVYDEVDLADMEWDEEDLAYFYPCPCGDRFFMPLEDLWDGEDIAACPSCSLTIRVLYDEAELPELPPEEGYEGGGGGEAEGGADDGEAGEAASAQGASVALGEADAAGAPAGGAAAAGAAADVGDADDAGATDAADAADAAGGGGSAGGDAAVIGGAADAAAAAAAAAAGDAAAAGASAGSIFEQVVGEGSGALTGVEHRIDALGLGKGAPGESVDDTARAADAAASATPTPTD